MDIEKINVLLKNYDEFKRVLIPYVHTIVYGKDRKKGRFVRMSNDRYDARPVKVIRYGKTISLAVTSIIEYKKL